jgi:malonyl-CoA O-methyltransferase
MTAPDRRAVRRAFRRAAADYAERDFLHAEIRLRLLEHLDPVQLEPRTIIDLGSGPPPATAALAGRFPTARLLAIDTAPEMLGAVPRGWSRVCAEAERLPLADASADLVVAGMVLHWCSDPERALAEARRVLRFPGLFLFSTLGPDSLRELRVAWAGVDDRSHVLRFADMHDIGDALVRAGFSEPVVAAEKLTVTYPDVDALAADLRAVGAADASRNRRTTLTGRDRWRSMCAAYEQQRTERGVLPATVEVIYGVAWSGEQRAPRTGGTIEFPLSRLRR